MKNIKLKDHHFHVRKYVSQEILNQGIGCELNYFQDDAAEHMKRYILTKCLETELEPELKQAVLSVDCYVFNQEDLDNLIFKVRAQGANDHMRFARFDIDPSL